MAAIEPQRGRSPQPDDRWVPGTYSRDELEAALIHGGMAGVVGHPLDNVLWKIDLLCEGDERSQFGLSGVDRFSPEEVMAMVAEASGWTPDPLARFGPFRVEPAQIIAACEAVGDRLNQACQRGESVLLATGHPSGVIMLYAEVGRLIEARGAKLLTPLSGVPWQSTRKRGRHEIRYINGVAVLSIRASAVHTHSSEPMHLMLQEVTPDLVFADHGFAGAAIEAGIDTVSIADVNDPALLVAKRIGKTETVIVMDDNVRPEDYWPCFQVIASRISE